YAFHLPDIEAYIGYPIPLEQHEPEGLPEIELPPPRKRKPAGRRGGGRGGPRGGPGGGPRGGSGGASGKGGDSGATRRRGGRKRRGKQASSA
ncbi:MAG: ATP-dependent RNA helicase RhlB, partial [Xanthomonadales bacterium]|nr:ATP-dependent RNA helicase RhlB [Xanthomonadales bacterium]